MSSTLGTGETKSGVRVDSATFESIGGTSVVPATMKQARSREATSASVRRHRSGSRLRKYSTSVVPSTCIQFGWMKLRCPIKPLVEPLITSLLRSLPPPARPAAHASFSFSRLSSNNLAMLSCGMRLPLRNEAVQLGRGRRREELLAEGLLAEHLRELREDLQVHVGRAVGDEQ